MTNRVRSSRPRWLTVVLLVLAGAACIGLALLAPRKRKVREPACSESGARIMCQLGTDPFACGWIDILDDHRGASLDTLLDVAAAADDDALRAALPFLAGERFADDALSPPPPTFTFRSFAPYLVALPIDWGADPYRNKTWRLELQSLSWLRGVDLDVAAAVIRDWGARAMTASPEVEFAWHDAGMAKRLEAVIGFLERYAASRDVLDRGTVRAAARIVIAHLHAMSARACYTRNDNHGMMELVAVLGAVRKLPHLRARDLIWDTALARTVDHVARSVRQDGIHVEHSPDYQVLYLALLLDAIDAIEAEAAAPASLIDARDRMFDGVVHLLQPNQTMPQFGDTENGDKRRLGRMVAQARAQAASDPRTLDELDWVISRGASGTMPATLDRVFVDGGYAAFRERWDAGAPTSPVTGHFTCTNNPLSRAHYHKDETSFELYGHGTELIVDSGKFSYDLKDPFTAYQYEVAAHNLLVVDGASYGPVDDARIVDHGVERDWSWVQGAHSGYQQLGVHHVRTFAFARPDAFIVIDHLDANRPHEYAQHFHLAPGLDQLTQVDPSTVIARSSSGGPGLLLRAATPPETIDQLRGVTAGGYQGWYFPSWQKAEPATDVVFRYRAGAGTLALPVLITIQGPNVSPAIPSAVDYQQTAAAATVTWTIGTSSRSVTVPTPAL